MNCNDNYEVNLKEPINHEKMIKRIQMEYRRLEQYLKCLNNREMELCIIRLQESAHWAFHSIMRHQAENTDEKKDG